MANVVPPTNAVRLNNVRANAPLSIDHKSQSVVVVPGGQPVNLNFKKADAGGTLKDLYRIFVPSEEKYLVVTEGGIKLCDESGATKVGLAIESTSATEGDNWVIKDDKNKNALTLSDDTPQVIFAPMTATKSQQWKMDAFRSD